MQEMQETQVQYLGQEEPLEQELATHSSILAWKISWTEEPGGSYSPWGRKELDMTEATQQQQQQQHFLSSSIKKKNLCGTYH